MIKTLVANVSKKDLYDLRQLNKSKQFACVCIAFTEQNEKIASRRATVRMSCKPFDDYNHYYNHYYCVE
jgi:hypothetical protein